MKINLFSKRRSLAVIAVLAMLMGLLPGSVSAAPLPAQVIVPVPGGPLTVNVAVVNDGAGGQTDPHVSGDWVSYTDNSVYGIRFQNLDLDAATDRLIPHADGVYDSLSDISDNTIVFMRTTHISTNPDGTGISSQGVYEVQIDPFGNPGPATEVSPLAGSLPIRGHAAIGGDTIAYEDRGYGGSTSSPSEISLSSAMNPESPAYQLTDDTVSDQAPAVSPDGNAAVWVKCMPPSWPNTCDVWRAERTDGVWGIPEQVTGTDGSEVTPVTNGPVTVYVSDAGGDVNIRWSVKDESGAYVESVLALPGLQRGPNISGSLIVFQNRTAIGGTDDIWLYNMATNRLYQLTNNSKYERLMDVATGPGGLVRVAWVEDKVVYPFDNDIIAMSFVLDTTPPAITPDVQGTQGANGWYTSDVTLSWAISDAQSPFTSTDCDPVTITSDQAAIDYTCSADSDGGASSASVTIARDATRPATTVTGVAAGATYNLGGVPQAGCASTDTLSGVATEATLALTGGDAQGVGDITATCSGALDSAGNPADPAVVHFTVVNPVSGTYNFAGFFQPVDNPGPGPSYIFNSVKAGGAIPFRFSLGGDQGLGILADGYPTSRPVSCTTAALTDPIEQTVTAGNSSLSYDTASDTYIYVWKTNKGWAGTCRVLTVQLADGTQHLAYFQFK